MFDKDGGQRVKKVIITGANSGLGKATTYEMLKRGYEVIMVCRSEKRGVKAFQEILEQSQNKHVVLELCDLSSFESILEFSKRIKEKYEAIDVLINNAGVILTKRQETKEGFEMQIGVNHFGHVLLTRELLPLLKKADSGRIVVVSSGAHKGGKIYFHDLQLKKNYSTFRAYAQSKLANVLYVKSMAKKLRQTNVTINAVHPGAVGTNFGVDRDTGFGKTLLKVLGIFFLTPEEGARTIIYLADSKEVEGKSGGYYYKQKPSEISKYAKQRSITHRFYKLTNALIDEKLKTMMENR